MLKNIFTQVQCIITSILLFLIISTLVLSNTILNQKYLIKAIEKNNYSTKVYNSIKNEYIKLSPSLNIKEQNSHLEEIINEEIVKKDIKNLINSIYTNKNIYITNKRKYK